MITIVWTSFGSDMKKLFKNIYIFEYWIFYDIKKIMQVVRCNNGIYLCFENISYLLML